MTTAAFAWLADSGRLALELADAYQVIEFRRAHQVELGLEIQPVLRRLPEGFSEEKRQFRLHWPRALDHAGVRKG